MKSFKKRSVSDLLIITLLTITLGILVWFPYYLRLPNFLGLDFSQGVNTIYRNFDGLEYVVIAKTFYNPQAIATLPQSLSANYYAAHFPGYALFILLFAPLLGFLKSMVFSSLLFTLSSAIVFYYLVRDFKLSEHPLFLSVVFLVLPARWLIVHSVGSAEPLFIFLTITTLYCFLKFEQTKKIGWIWLTAIAAVGSQLTRPPGILLGLALLFYIFWQILYDKTSTLPNRFLKSLSTYYPLILIPLSLLVVFYWYSLVYQDFFAYFHSGDNIHLTFPPYQVFNQNQFWVGSIWLEDIVYILLLGFAGGVALWKQRLYPLAFFVLTYLGASTLVAHRDVSRYVLPIFPFVLIAFEKYLTSREFKIVFAIIALAIYLYAQNFLLANTAPVPNLEAFN